MRDGLDGVSLPRHYQPAFGVVAARVATGQHDPVVQAERASEALLPGGRAQSIFLGLGASLDGIEVLALQGQVQVTHPRLRH